MVSTTRLLKTLHRVPRAKPVLARGCTNAITVRATPSTDAETANRRKRGTPGVVDTTPARFRHLVARLSDAWCGPGYTPGRRIAALDAVAEKPVVGASGVDRKIVAAGYFVADVQCARDVVVACAVVGCEHAPGRGTFIDRTRNEIEAIHCVIADVENGIACVQRARQSVVTRKEPGALAPCDWIAGFDTVT